MTPPEGIPCKHCGKQLCSGDSVGHIPDVCPHCGFVYKDVIWKEDGSQGVYRYRIKNDINLSGNPIFVIQRREEGRHCIGNWKTYSLRVYQENEKEEAEKILKHLNVVPYTVSLVGIKQ